MEGEREEGREVAEGVGWRSGGSRGGGRDGGVNGGRSVERPLSRGFLSGTMPGTDLSSDHLDFLALSTARLFSRWPVCLSIGPSIFPSVFPLTRLAMLINTPFYSLHVLLLRLLTLAKGSFTSEARQWRW